MQGFPKQTFGLIVILKSNSSRVILAQLRHGNLQESAKCFKINSGDRRVYTTFSIRIEAAGQRDAELVQQLFLFRAGRGDAS